MLVHNQKAAAGLKKKVAPGYLAQIGNRRQVPVRGSVVLPRDRLQLKSFLAEEVRPVSRLPAYLARFVRYSTGGFGGG
jgi:hypothetical protein